MNAALVLGIGENFLKQIGRVDESRQGSTAILHGASEPVPRICRNGPQQGILPRTGKDQAFGRTLPQEIHCRCALKTIEEPVTFIIVDEFKGWKFFSFLHRFAIAFDCGRIGEAIGKRCPHLQARIADKAIEWHPFPSWFHGGHGEFSNVIGSDQCHAIAIDGDAERVFQLDEDATSAPTGAP
jgi:hypothetical protein